MWTHPGSLTISRVPKKIETFSIINNVQIKVAVTLHLKLISSH